MVLLKYTFSAVASELPLRRALIGDPAEIADLLTLEVYDATCAQVALVDNPWNGVYWVNQPVTLQTPLVDDELEMIPCPLEFFRYDMGPAPVLAAPPTLTVSEALPVDRLVLVMNEAVWV